MKIRRLEIQGFKSFAERTVLKFGDGITGVVGPNGCGKSNIVDAIRWVMGEQSAKHLRGAGMQDVIFAGSESRGPLGLCEVTITFKNDGQLVPPEYQKFEEIGVTRRLFRDGTSEYAINKVPCRLRDILDLFMGTGIGKNAYSIIEQGRIGLIVTAKAEDRRALIEDAAGVSRYKARRKQAERRIEATEANLLRINDITAELSQRLSALERQAKKAERYRRIKAELKDLDLHAAAHRHLELEALERHEAGKAALLREQIAADEENISADEARVVAALGELSARDEAIRTREAKVHEHQQAVALAHNNVAFLERERAKLEERRREATTELSELEDELIRLEAERAEAQAILGEDMAGAAGEELRTLDEKEAQLEGLTRALEDAQVTLETDKQSMVDALTAIAHHKNNITSLDRAAGELDLQIARAMTAKRAAAEKAKEAGEKAKELSGVLAGNRQLRLSLEDERSAQEELLAKLKGDLADTEHQLTAARQELMTKRSRLSSLLDIQKNYEGCTEAVRSIMRRKEQDPSLSASLHGLVADVIAAEPRFEAAVEAVLGDRLQWVIVNSQDDGIRSIQHLKDEQQGRSSFVPLDLREDHVSWAPRKASQRPSRGPGGSSSSLPPASSPPSTPPVASAPPALSMLGEAAVSEIPIVDSQEPTAASSAPPARAPIPVRAAAGAQVVGPNGEVMQAGGGGGFAPGEGSVFSELPVPEAADSFYFGDEDWWPDLEAPGVCGKLVDLVRAQPGYEHVARVLMGDVVVVEDLARARDVWVNNGHRKTLVTLSGEVLDPVGVLTGGSTRSMSAGMLGQKREIKELTDLVRMLEAKVLIAEEQHGTLKIRLADLEKNLQRLSKEGHQEELSIVNLERDLRRFEEEATLKGAERATLDAELEALRAKRAGLEAEVKASKDALVQLEAQRTEAEARVASHATAASQLKEQVRALSAEVTHRKVEMATNREKRDSSRRNLQRILQRLEDVKQRIVKLQEIIEESGREAARLGERIEETGKEAAAREQVLTAEREEATRLRAELETESQALREEDAQFREKRKAIDGLKDALSQAMMRAREQQLGRETLAEQIEERYRVKLSEVLQDFHLLPPQSEEHKKEADKLRRQLDNIGPINLTAIEEFEQVNERYQFLMAQKKDLEEAIASLRAAIKRINRTSKDRYVEAFRLVNEKFQQIFPKLFNGGRCALVMNDESDPLESGIEMLAQPPGKKLQNVGLLSGGEKALTAVALIFAIFLIKPTPFCLLDEVDAPLDEANVGRYNEMLREMSAISQFILITHNKRTMELPDRLYGVTMEEPGISKLVPVDIQGAERKLKAVS